MGLLKLSRFRVRKTAYASGEFERIERIARYAARAKSFKEQVLLYFALREAVDLLENDLHEAGAEVYAGLEAERGGADVVPLRAEEDEKCAGS